ncbi:MAG: flagellar biosynthesis protein FlhF [Lachnospiraceae bacterium]|nr:flagellar biosynthesis protein FlhF [Lachnospiraceae bacterium]
MVIKKFQAASENEAMLQVKEEMGSDAVIMNIKKTKHKGVMKLFKPTLVEVTAAIEEASDEPIIPKKKESLNLVADEPVKFTMEEIPQIMEELEEKNDSFDYGNISKNETAIEEKLDNLQNLLEKQMGKEMEEVEEEDENDETMKFLQLIYNTLLDNEVNEKYANQLIDEISVARKENVSIDTLLANIYQKMILKFGEPVPVTKGNSNIVFFVGPTGVGKTTTVAKIASKLKLEEKKNIVLLTTDTYRIAATEQLHTYAEILDVPFRVIYTPEEMKEAKEEFQDYDMILVDTAGHSPSNQEQHNDLKRFIDSVDGEAETKNLYLVVSVTTKYKDLLKIVDSYQDFQKVKIIFTKLDETTTLGNILNLRMYTNADLSYVTCGQNVPDDIGLLDAQKIVRKLLGGH